MIVRFDWNFLIQNLLQQADPIWRYGQHRAVGTAEVDFAESKAPKGRDVREQASQFGGSRFCAENNVKDVIILYDFPYIKMDVFILIIIHKRIKNHMSEDFLSLVEN